MDAVLGLPENAGVLAHLGQGRDPADATFGPPPPGIDRWRLGAHPDVVDRLWETLNAALPTDGRWLVFDTPALVHAPSGRVLAVALGTTYALRLTPADAAAAVAAGAELVHHYRSVGTVLDLAAAFGPGWMFGTWDAREGGWLASSHRAAG